MGEPTRSRRRGTELENAILTAGWEQLVTEGYDRFTVEAVAVRARTSKPVLYRRWADREALFRATVRHRGATSTRPVPDTGSVRDDLLALLRSSNSSDSNAVALMSVLTSSHFTDIGMTPRELRAELIGNGETSVERVLRRAARRGEVDPAVLSPRIIDLPFALFRHEYLMTFRPVPEETLEEILDDVVLPLVRSRG